MRNFNVKHITPSKESSWLQPALHLALQTLTKIAQSSAFTGLLLQNKLLWQRWIYNIHYADPLPKDGKLFVCFNHLGKDCFQQDLGGSGEKSPSKDMQKKKNIPTFEFFTTSFFTWKPNPVGLGNCSVPNFCKTSFRYFCSLVTGT